MNNDDWFAGYVSAGVDPYISKFIDDIASRGAYVVSFFEDEYSYYFANMLQDAFKSGTVCLVVGTRHVVWVSADYTAWDINGVYKDGHLGNLIPVSDLWGTDIEVLKKPSVKNKSIEAIDKTIEEVLWHKRYIRDNSNSEYYSHLGSTYMGYDTKHDRVVISTRDGYCTGEYEMSELGNVPCLEQNAMKAFVFPCRYFADDFIAKNYKWFMDKGSQYMKIVKLDDVPEEHFKTGSKELKSMF